MKKKWINRIGNILLLLCMYFLCMTLYKQDIQWSQYINSSRNIGIYGIVILTYIFTIYISAYVYRKILTLFPSKKIDNRLLTDIYVTANLGKYLPGNIMHFVGRNLLASKYDMGQTHVTLSTILELVMILITSGIIAVIFAFSYITEVIEYIYIQNRNIFLAMIILSIIMIFIIIIIGLKFKDKIIDIVCLFKEKRSRGILLRCMSIDVCIQMLSSFTYILVIISIYDGEILHPLNVIGIYLLAWLAGFIIPGAPGGIGIKEGILLLLLKNIIPSNIILVSVVIHRCLNILAEVISFIIMKCYTYLV